MPAFYECVECDHMFRVEFGELEPDFCPDCEGEIVLVQAVNFEADELRYGWDMDVPTQPAIHKKKPEQVAA